MSLRVKGMSCASCVARVEKAIRGAPYRLKHMAAVETLTLHQLVAQRYSPTPLFDRDAWKRKTIDHYEILLKAKKKTAPRGGEKSSNKTNRAIRLQYGVLPYRFTETNSLEVLLVTTRQTRRWIVPKGWPIKGLKPPRSAAREAYEEAGIRGTVGAKAIGVLSYEKGLDASGVTVPCEVRVFPMIVKRQLDTWPEANEREARWFEQAKALSVIKDKGLL